VKDSVDLLIISAVYLPSRYTVKQEQLDDYYNALGCRFIAGGDYNAKFTAQGYRRITPRGRELFKTTERNNFKQPSMEEPTYWQNKLLYLVDFCVTKGIPQDFALA
jgi:hypothetical protein